MKIQTAHIQFKSKFRLVFLLALLLSVLTSSPEVTDFGAVFSAQNNCLCEALAAAVTVQENESLDKSDSSKNENFEESLPQRSQSPTRANSREQLQLVFHCPLNVFLANVTRTWQATCVDNIEFSTLPRWLMLRTLLI